jgi:hypothetical protein
VRYVDLSELSENVRIGILGQEAAQGYVVGFFVEDDDKANRYIRKLRFRFAVEVVSREHLTVGGAEVVYVRLRRAPRPGLP